MKTKISSLGIKTFMKFCIKDLVGGKLQLFNE